ncbi:MAG: SDR family NAD(P)-dependent oxidoreductase [Tepidisphaeraceae bacterium]
MDHTTSLAGHKAALTGSTSGMGLEAAAMLAEAGVSHLLINGRNEERGQAARRKLLIRAPATSIRFVAADVSTKAGAQRFAAAASDHFGGAFDVLVTAAGGDEMPTFFHEMPLEEIDAVIAHWMLSTFYCTRLMLPMINDGGSIIHIASDAAKVPTPGESIVGAAMAAITMFSRTLAMEAKRRRVRVNALTPSLVRDTIHHDIIMSHELGAKLFSKAISAAKLGVPQPADIAALIVFLASPQSSKMTGQVISVNGGISA